MKSKILALISALVIGVFTLASCDFLNPTVQKPSEPENLIYGADTDLYLIWGDDVEEDTLVGFSEQLDELRGVTSIYADKTVYVYVRKLSSPVVKVFYCWGFLCPLGL